MKANRTVMLAVLISLSILSIPVFAGTYLDDFADGIDNGWVPLAGEWEAAEGIYKQTVAGDLWQRAMLATIDDLDYKVSDFEVSVTAQLPEGNSGWLGLVFLHGEIKVGQLEVAHYTFSLTYDGRNIVRIYKSSTGIVGNVNWVIDEPLNADLGKWYTYKVVVQGQKIECYANDKLLITEDDPGIFEAGKVGIFATKAPGAIFSTFQLTAANIPNSVAFSVQSSGKLATAWGDLKIR